METRECCCIFYKKAKEFLKMSQTNTCKGTVYIVKDRESTWCQGKRYHETKSFCKCI